MQAFFRVGSASGAMITELVPLVLRRPKDSLVMTSALLGWLSTNYLACNSLVNELHQNLILERFCKERKSSRVERGLAH